MYLVKSKQFNSDAVETVSEPFELKSEALDYTANLGTHPSFGWHRGEVKGEGQSWRLYRPARYGGGLLAEFWVEKS